MLKNWLVSQLDAASHISQQRFRPDEPMQLYRPESEKTVAERAVDKVTGTNSY
jgi:hypothetical protein